MVSADGPALEDADRDDQRRHDGVEDDDARGRRSYHAPPEDAGRPDQQHDDQDDEGDRELVVGAEELHAGPSGCQPAGSR